MTFLRVGLLFCFALWASGCSSDAEAESSGQESGEDAEGEEKPPEVLRERYVLSYSGRHVDGELCVNGVCIAAWENGSEEKTRVLDGWLIPGRNVVTLALAETLSRPPPRSFSARLQRERWYADTARGVIEDVLDFEWPKGEIYDRLEERRIRREHLEPLGLEDGVVRALEDGTYPSPETLASRGVTEPETVISDLDARVEEYRKALREKTVEHDLPHAYQLAFSVDVDVGTQLWTRAEKVDLDDDDREELVSLARDLHQAVSERRLKDVVGMLSYAVVDTGRAEEQPEDHSTRALEFRLKRLFGQKRGYRVSKFKPKDLVFEPVASGKLVAISAVDGSPPITVKSREGNAAFQPYFARIDGRWVIARTNEI